jgi:hypothetical protein
MAKQVEGLMPMKEREATAVVCDVEKVLKKFGFWYNIDYQYKPTLKGVTVTAHLKVDEK